MPAFRFDWRWVVAIAVVAVLANARTLPWPISSAVLAAVGGYLLVLAWRSWGGGGPRRPAPATRVTYWRGQRIETSGPVRRAPISDLSSVGPVLLYGLIGLALLLVAVAIAARGLGVSL